MSFDPMSFDPMAFDPRSFDPMSVNRYRCIYFKDDRKKNIKKIGHFKLFIYKKNIYFPSSAINPKKVTLSIEIKSLET